MALTETIRDAVPRRKQSQSPGLEGCVNDRRRDRVRGVQVASRPTRVWSRLGRDSKRADAGQGGIDSSLHADSTRRAVK